MGHQPSNKNTNARSGSAGQSQPNSNSPQGRQPKAEGEAPSKQEPSPDRRAGTASDAPSQGASAHKRSPSYDDAPDDGENSGVETDRDGRSQRKGTTQQRDTLPRYGDALPDDPRRSNVEARGRSTSLNPGSENVSESAGSE